MIIKTKVEKIGELGDYINLPVTNKLTFNSLDDKTKVIGIVREVTEVDDKYELSIFVWDRFVTQGIEQTDNKPVSMSINFL